MSIEDREQLMNVIIVLLSISLFSNNYVLAFVCAFAFKKMMSEIFSN